MAEGNSFVLEAAKNQLDENENPSLMEFNATFNNVENQSLVDSENTNSVADSSYIINDTTDVSFKDHNATPTKKLSIDYSQKIEALKSGDGNDFLASANNNLSNGVHESSYNMASGPNLMENSLSSSEDKTSKALNFSALSEGLLSNINNLNETSFESAVFDKTCGTVNENDNHISASEFSAFPNDLLASEGYSMSNEESQLKEHEFLKPCNLVDLTEEKKICDGSPNIQDPEQTEVEEFQDAVQFFKDPSSFQFLENIKTSEEGQQPYATRDSLYIKFDPLHVQVVKTQAVAESLQTSGALSVSNIENFEITDTSGNTSTTEPEPVLVNKFVNKPSVRESVGDYLLSFDSPLKTELARISEGIPESPFSNTPRLYTEEELQQARKNCELAMQEHYLKKQKEIDDEMLKKIHEKDDVIDNLSKMYRCLKEVIGEVSAITTQLHQENIALVSRAEELELEKKKIDGELKISKEDLNNTENTFSGFHKRYEQCKDMLKTYKDNEERFKEQIENLNCKLEEQEQMYNMLQTKTEEIVEKANFEVANARRGGEAQLAVLKAQLKKSELKVSSLESDLRQVRVENENLSSICDDLMAKVSSS